MKGQTTRTVCLQGAVASLAVWDVQMNTLTRQHAEHVSRINRQQERINATLASFERNPL